MASRAEYLVNQVNPALVRSNSTDCREGAIRITCTGMGNTGNAWQVWVGDTKSGVWQDVVRYGVPVIFSNNMTQYVEIFAGKYRVNPSSLLSTAIVYFEEDEQTDHDSKVLYTFAQQNNNQNGITAESTPSNAAVGNGTSASPLGFNVQYSNDGANLAHAGMDGAVDATINLSTDPSTAALSGTGTVGSPLAAAVTISADAGNGLSVGTDSGLFASAGATKLNLSDANDLATAFIALASTVNITLGGVIGVVSVTTTSDAVYISAQVANNPVTGVSAFSQIKFPLTMPAQGSIGATNLSLIEGGAQDHSTAAVYPSYGILGGANGILFLSAPSATVDVQFQFVLTLQ